MENNLDKLLAGLTMKSPTTLEEVAKFNALVGKTPHQDYLRFMMRHNGGDGPVGSRSYISIWPLGEVFEATEQSGANEFAPGLLLFAGDAGDKVYAFDRKDPHWPIVSVSLTDMSRETMLFVASDFTQFIQRLSEN